MCDVTSILVFRILTASIGPVPVGSGLKCLLGFGACLTGIQYANTNMQTPTCVIPTPHKTYLIMWCWLYGIWKVYCLIHLFAIHTTSNIYTVLCGIPSQFLCKLFSITSIIGRCQCTCDDSCQMWMWLERCHRSNFAYLEISPMETLTVVLWVSESWQHWFSTLTNYEIKFNEIWIKIPRENAVENVFKMVAILFML